MIEKPTVSVVMTVHNGEQYVGLALGSLLAQTYPNLELRVVMDGCADNTEAIVQESTAADSRIVASVHPRIGRAAALNIGVTDSSGSIIAIMDADDFAFPWRMEHTVLAFNEYGTRFPMMGTESVPFSDTVPSVPVPNRGLRIADASGMLRRGSPFAHSSLAFTRECFVRLGGYDVRRSGQFDYDFYVRNLEMGRSVGLVDCTTVAIRRHPESYFVSKGGFGYRWRANAAQRRAIAAQDSSYNDRTVLAARTAATFVPPRLREVTRRGLKSRDPAHKAGSGR